MSKYRINAHNTHNDNNNNSLWCGAHFNSRYLATYLVCRRPALPYRMKDLSTCQEGKAKHGDLQRSRGLYKVHITIFLYEYLWKLQLAYYIKYVRNLTYEVQSWVGAAIWVGVSSQSCESFVRHVLETSKQSLAALLNFWRSPFTNKMTQC